MKSLHLALLPLLLSTLQAAERPAVTVGKGNELPANLISDRIVRARALEKPTAVHVPLKPGAPFDYAKFAFQPKSWEKRGLSLQLIPWVGTNVMFLTTNANLDPDLMAKWVSRLDAGWQLYADLTGRKPNPFRQFEGKVTIAEMTEAYFGSNDFYPFVTGEPKQAEPETFALLEEIGGPLPVRTRR